MNKEAKQFLIKDIKERRTPDFFEVFDEKNFMRIIDDLSLSEEKAWDFVSEIDAAYSICKPSFLKDKNVHAANQKKQIKALANASKTLTTEMQKKLAILIEEGEPDVQMRKESEWILLDDLRDAENFRETGTRVVNRYGRNYEANPENKLGIKYLYSFDKKASDLMEQLSWFEAVVTLALEKAKSGAKNTNGKQADLHDWKFFIWVCNIYYKYTGKVPEVRYSGGTSPDYRGDVLRFLENCYIGFRIINKNRGKEGFRFEKGAYWKLKEIKAGRQPENLKGIIPDWLT